MATQNTGGGTTTSFTTTPQAQADIFAAVAGINIFDVMANDLGGNAKTLWSIDNGTNNTGAMSGYVAGDLLSQDLGRTEALSTDTSKFGAKIWITADGKLGYDTDTAAFQAKLASGQPF